MPKKKRGPTEKDADRLFSKVIRARDKLCVRCGTSENLQCAHVWSRSYRSVRFDERNAFALCRGCHVYFTNHQIEWEDFVEGLIGEEAFLQLRLDAVPVAGRRDFKELCERLTERLKEVTDDMGSDGEGVSGVFALRE